MLSTIPFSGFYCTLHDDVISRAIENLFEDNNGECDSKLINHFYKWGSIDWCGVRNEYAKDYTSFFAKSVGLEITFVELNSPKEYNFQTDRIFVDISAASVIKMFAEVDKDRLRQYIKERFTTRSGFISYYPSDLDEWQADLMKWDHNQIGTLIEIVVDFDENEYVNKMAISSEVDSWVYTNLTDEGLRLSNISCYLRKRQKR